MNSSGVSTPQVAAVPADEGGPDAPTRRRPVGRISVRAGSEARSPAPCEVPAPAPLLRSAGAVWRARAARDRSKKRVASRLGRSSPDAIAASAFFRAVDDAVRPSSDNTATPIEAVTRTWRGADPASGYRTRAARCRRNRQQLGAVRRPDRSSRIRRRRVGPATCLWRSSGLRGGAERAPASASNRDQHLARRRAMP